jgi:DNA-directed RNA polymerase specialized sigma24 family protein
MRINSGRRIRVRARRLIDAVLSIGDALYALTLDLQYALRNQPPTTSDLQAVLCHVVTSLNPPRRNVLVMMVIQEKAPREVADQLHLSLRRVRRRWSSAVTAVETRLKMEGIDLLDHHPPEGPPRKMLPVAVPTRMAAVLDLMRRAA